MVKIVESRTVVGLEVGTSKVVAVVGEVLPDGVVNVLGVGSCPSKGIDKGSITDLSAVVNSIQRAIEAAESIADCEIRTVTLAITGEHIQSLNESGFVPIPVETGEVTQDEIDLAMHTARSVKLPEGLSLLHVIPQEYAVDKQQNIKKSVGVARSSLTCSGTFNRLPSGLGNKLEESGRKLRIIRGANCLFRFGFQSCGIDRGRKRFRRLSD